MQKVFDYECGSVTLLGDIDLSFLDYENEYYHQKVQTKTRVNEHSYFLGIEMIAHRGGVIRYGMLCTSVQPNAENDSVNISIAYTNENNVRYQGVSQFDYNHTYKGMPYEYLESVRNSVINTILEKKNYPQCSIDFIYSANCEVGSSPMFFSMLAEVIMNIIYDETYDEVWKMNTADFTNQYLKKFHLK